MTPVFDMRTATYTDYTLSPFEAVVAAYAQREQRDFNTWTYHKYHSKVTMTPSHLKTGVTIVTCGNQSAIAVTGKEKDESTPCYDYEVGTFKGE